MVILKIEIKRYFKFFNMTNVLEHFKIKNMTLLMRRREYLSTDTTFHIGQKCKLIVAELEIMALEIIIYCFSKVKIQVHEYHQYLREVQ